MVPYETLHVNVVLLGGSTVCGREVMHGLGLWMVASHINHAMETTLTAPWIMSTIS